LQQQNILEAVAVVRTGVVLAISGQNSIRAIGNPKFQAVGMGPAERRHKTISREITSIMPLAVFRLQQPQPLAT
jgi:hypothetical protein